MRIITIQILVVLLAFIELFTIGSIAAFLNLITEPDKIKGLIEIVPYFKGRSNEDIFLSISLSLVFVLSFSAFFSIYIHNKSIILSTNIGHYISSKLMAYYLSRDWLYHSSSNSSVIVNNIVGESGRLSNSVIRPFMLATSKLILMLVISTAIFIYNPFMTTMILLFFLISYMTISKVVRRKLRDNSYVISKENKERIQTVNESFDNVKMLILNDKIDFFLKKFEHSNLLMTQRVASNMVLGASPRYIMEWLAFVSMIAILIIYICLGNELSEIIPLLTIYGLAALKLLPSLQFIYASLSTIKGNVSALETISSELSKYKVDKHSKCRNVSFSKSISIKNAFFRYPGKDTDALSSLNINIDKNKTIGIVGQSGAGKSTLIDVLCGLIKIDSGSFRVDDYDINNEITSWQRQVSYVPQSISLSDASIAENIAFGEPYTDIDWQLLDKVVELSYLDDLIKKLDNGIDTIVGEKGVQLSGGQRQRIGIARALYKQASVLILDEATSALDGVTENKIMQAINNLSGKMTIIIIAHRLKTIKNCDSIYMLDNGKVVDCNTYEGLMATNPSFREMEKYA
ncbi:ABC transporter ATP-binding protein [Vibrio panuliri]|nr:ABC transporter ATP-binding protein [Vibrio panuliri]